MKADDLLAHGLRSFFEDHLRIQRNLSPLTVLAYRDVVKLFLTFAAHHRRLPVAALGLEHLDAETVLAFLEHLEQQRGACITTRNHRLAALHSLYRHLAGLDPQYFHHCQRVLAIPFKRAASRPVEYLTQEEMAALLDQPDRRTAAGQRDYVLLSLLYNTGCRVQEILDLRPCDLSLDRPYQARILGKGQKERICPLWPQTAALVKDWLGRRGIPRTHQIPLFMNQRGQPLTRFGVRYRLRVYRRTAQQAAPSLDKKRLHPHVLRHTTAMHLLQAGVEMHVVSRIMGHAHLTTTNRYAEADLQMKRRAIEAATSKKSQPKQLPRWKKDKDLIEWLESL